MPRQLLGGLAMFLITLGLAYFAVVMVSGLMEFRVRARRPVVDDASAGRRARQWTHVVLIPALNESAVIANTLRSLRSSFGSASTEVRVIVIDDASNDHTSGAVAALGWDACTVLRRELPDAQRGKGDALNAAFREVQRDVEQGAFDADETLIWVMDADGRLSDGAAGHVEALFEDPKIGGVQLPVAIRTSGSIATRLQHLEFWTLSAVSQLGRARRDSVSLGGNGQVTRFNALQQLDGVPWTDSLTEDLDLALRLMLKGWKLTTTTLASVNQQGVESYRRLLRQRTRWYQGTMQCAARVPEIWRCEHLSNAAAMETCMYLMLPLLLVLPWSIVFHLVIVDTAQRVTNSASISVLGSSGLGHVVMFTVWYVMSFLPNLALGLMHASRVPNMGKLKAIGLAHLMIPYNYIAYAATWLALGRILLGRNVWSKTARSIEATVAQ